MEPAEDNGFAGRLLYVDLTTGQTRAEALAAGFAREWMGGLGLGAKVYFDMVKDRPSHAAPLSPESPFVLMTCPLNGQTLNAAARWGVGARSPLTGFWGEANVGGFFGGELKAAGFDGLVVTGAADAPVYLEIDDGSVAIRDASWLWGRDTFDTETEIIASHRQKGKKRGQVLCTGPAGERLVRYAALVHAKGHVAGRTGMGAVWGAKKLKAIYVRGSGRPGPAWPDRLSGLRAELDEVYAASITVEGLRAFGTASGMDVGVMLGDVPMKNWGQGDWERFEQLAPVAYGEKILVGSGTCQGCGVRCKREVEVKEGPFRMAPGPGPEYETIAAFGTLCLNPDLESVAKANDVCNRLGMDTISCGSTVAFAIDCFERGILSTADTDGLELTWGNSQAIVDLVEKIGRRQGVGDLLAEGSALAAARIGKGAEELLSTVKGLEAPMHDPRASHGYALAYGVSPRGACHMASLEYTVESGGMYLPDIPACTDEIEGPSSQGKAALNEATQDFGMFFSSCAGFCNLGGMVLTATQAVDVVNAVTGFEYSLEEVTRLGRRVWYLKRGLSQMFGARAVHDQLPPKLLAPLPDGPVAGVSPDFDLMLAEFYALRGLTPDGLPSRRVLDDLQLSELADSLGL